MKVLIMARFGCRKVLIVDFILRLNTTNVVDP